MRTILVAIAMLLAAGGAGAVEIRAYEMRVDVTPDGAGLTRASVHVTGVQPGRILLPVGFAALDEFKDDAAVPGTVLTPRAGKDQSQVEIEFGKEAPPEVNLAFSFRVPGVLYAPKPEEGQKPTFPAGSRLLRHSFVNTQSTAIERYRVQVQLPDESQVHAIREQLPKPKRKEYLPRVELDRFDGRQGALLQFTGLKQGDRTSMELEMMKQGRSLAWLLVLAPLALAYLFAFRDLVKR